MLESGLTLIGMLFAVVAILGLAYVATKWIATHSTGIGIPAGVGAGSDFCVLRQLTVGRAERLLLVRLNEQCMLVGVTSGSITVLKELEPEEAERWLHPEQTAAAPSFLEVLKANLSKKK